MFFFLTKNYLKRITIMTGPYSSTNLYFNNIVMYYFIWSAYTAAIGRQAATTAWTFAPETDEQWPCNNNNNIMMIYIIHIILAWCMLPNFVIIYDPNFLQPGRCVPIISL